MCSVTCFALIGLRCQQLRKELCKTMASTRLHEYLGVSVCRTSGRRVAQASLHLLVDRLRTQRRVRRGFRSRPQQQAKPPSCILSSRTPFFHYPASHTGCIVSSLSLFCERDVLLIFIYFISTFHSMGEWGNQSLSPCAFHYQLLCSDCNY